MEGNRLRLADLIAAYGDDFLARHGAGLTPEARRALADVAACRTAVLGGQARRCACCGHVEVHYRSCGNRACPGCGAGKRAAWRERGAGLLLPVAYHHMVFTLNGWPACMSTTGWCTGSRRPPGRRWCGRTWPGTSAGWR